VADGVAVKEVELRGRTGQLQGLLVLVHKTDTNHSNASFLDFANQLSGMLAVSVETRQLIESQKGLLDGVIRLMADAIDAKSPYTGGHCERVPALATLMVERMCADTTGPYAAFQMNEDERYEFRLGAWLHDCGKVTSPEHIVDKATKLELIYNRIHEFACGLRCCGGTQKSNISACRRWRRCICFADHAPRSPAATSDRFRVRCPVQCRYGIMADDSIARLQVIATKPGCATLTTAWEFPLKKRDAWRNATCPLQPASS
jgi:hypothetical protein